MQVIRPLIALASSALTLVLMTGCASTSIESVGDPQAYDTFSRVYVLIGHQGLDSTIAEKIVAGMTSVLSDRLRQLGIAVDIQSIFRNPDQLTLNDRVDFDRESIRRFGPDGLLTIQLSEIGWEGRRLAGVSHERDLKYDADFTAVASRKTIWRGRVDNKGYGQVGADWKELGEKTANEAIDRLLHDKILFTRPTHKPNPVG